MFLSFLMPYNIRNIEAPYLWVLYKQLSSFERDDIIFIASKEYFYKKKYFADQERWELTEESCNANDYKLPSDEVIRDSLHYCIGQNTFEELENKKQKCSNMVFQALLTERCIELEKELDKIVSECLDQYGEINAIFSWCNCPSLKAIADMYALKIIYNEWGPLRSPYYISTAYFDCSGVNGNTEAYQRYINFKSEIGNVPIYSTKDIVKILSINNDEFNYDNVHYEIGVPLQVEDDSNMLAYSNGFNNVNLLNLVNKLTYKEKILVRKHPGGWFDYNKNEHGIVDTSKNAKEFIAKCNQIYTINSSVGLEALLYGRKIHIVGDSPFRFLQDITNDNELLLAINFIVFGYLIPYKKLYDYQYCIWRLSYPSEREIYCFNMNYYINELKVRRDEERNELVDKYNELIDKYNELIDRYKSEKKELDYIKNTLVYKMANLIYRIKEK